MSNRRWLPVVVMVLLACGSERVLLEPGAPAGDVREVSGQVSAIRDGERRALTVGAVVSGDDVVHTAPEASVVIELRHNGVRWALGPGKQRRVFDSAAWTAPRGGSQVAVTDERSGAAGRHAEREAASTAASGVADDRAPAAADPPPVAAADPGPAAAADPPVAAQRLRVAEPAVEPIAAADEPKAAAMAPIQDDAPLAKRMAIATPSSPDGGGGGAAPATEGSAADLRVLGKRGAALVRACRARAKGATGRIEVAVTVDRRGRASEIALYPDAGLEAVADCARPALLRKLRFARRAAPATVRGPIALP